MIEIVDLRLKKRSCLSSEEFKNLILSMTKSNYESARVLPERTGIRNSRIEDQVDNFSEYFILQKKLFIVSALSRINSDKYSRYMVLIEPDSYDPEILDKIEEYIPVFLVNFKYSQSTDKVASRLSTWFRSNMGRGFSFVDIDFLLYNSQFTLLIEEKIGATNISSIGYGQLISYKELITDVLKKPNEILFVFSNEENHVKGEVDYFTCNSSSFTGNRFTVTPIIRTGKLSDIIFSYIK